jgi:hypothetical protein
MPGVLAAVPRAHAHFGYCALFSTPAQGQPAPIHRSLGWTTGKPTNLLRIFNVGRELLPELQMLHPAPNCPQRWKQRVYFQLVA